MKTTAALLIRLVATAVICSSSSCWSLLSTRALCSRQQRWGNPPCQTTRIVSKLLRRIDSPSYSPVKAVSNDETDTDAFLDEPHGNTEDKHPAFGNLLSRRTMLGVAAMSALSVTAAFTSSPLQATAAQQYENEEARRIAIFERTSPSVVFIDTFTERRDSLTTNIMEVPLGSGSGFVWDKQGHIVTNFHVVRNAQSAQVAILLSGQDAVAATKTIETSLLSETSTTGSSDITTSSTRPGNGRRSKSGANMVRRVFTAKIVGVDPGKDIAVLKIDADPVFLFPITVGTSTGIKVGQQAMAIGNPFGLDHTLTSGIISGTGREVRSPIGRPITDVLQTDAAINPGNSGGPLLDSNGKLIGMNTAIYSPTGASAGIGFAIPVDAVKFIVETLIRDGQVVRPVLGISFLGSKQARTLGISAGVLVLEVPPDSPAAKAGLKGTRRTESGLIGAYLD
jgi:S1-C subfamily serine protease